EKAPQLPYLKKDPFIEKIYNAKFKKAPHDFAPLTDKEIAVVNQTSLSSGLLPKQEQGIKPSCAVPYELYVEGGLTKDKQHCEITFTAGSDVFGKEALGTAFNVYFSGKNRSY